MNFTRDATRLHAYTYVARLEVWQVEVHNKRIAEQPLTLKPTPQKKAVCVPRAAASRTSQDAVLGRTRLQDTARLQANVTANHKSLKPEAQNLVLLMEHHTDYSGCSRTLHSCRMFFPADPPSEAMLSEKEDRV